MVIAQLMDCDSEYGKRLQDVLPISRKRKRKPLFKFEKKGN